MNSAHLHVDGVALRRYHLDGFLYYGTVEGYGNPSVNPWTNVYNFAGNGDGLLFYPGTTSMIGGAHPIPCDSIRLKCVRRCKTTST